MKPPSLSLDHVALPVLDAGRTRDFYRDVLGLTLVSALEGPDWDGRAWLMMIFADGEGRELALCAFAGLQSKLDADWPADVRHYAFGVRNVGELGAWKARLDGAGVAWREEDHGNQVSIYFSDPNGTTLEITARTAPGASDGDGADAVVDAWLARIRPTPPTA
jgi:catechol 2,3-dioxygenase-like lactoylglutathione lyase family enzyme